MFQSADSSARTGCSDNILVGGEYFIRLKVAILPSLNSQRNRPYYKIYPVFGVPLDCYYLKRPRRMNDSTAFGMTDKLTEGRCNADGISEKETSLVFSLRRY